MFTAMFDQAEARGEARGEAKGEAKREIKGSIKAYNRVGWSVSDIVSTIMEQFNLKQEEAQKYVEETLNLQKAE